MIGQESPPLGGPARRRIRRRRRSIRLFATHVDATWYVCSRESVNDARARVRSARAERGAVARARGAGRMRARARTRGWIEREARDRALRRLERRARVVSRRARVRMVCECGLVTFVRASRVRDGRTRACGAWKACMGQTLKHRLGARTRVN